MVALPRLAPVTTPPEVTDAMPAEELDHVPPATASVSVRVFPKVTVVAPPEIAAGEGFTETVPVEVEVQPVPETLDVIVVLVGVVIVVGW